MITVNVTSGPASDLSGPCCGSNNATLTYELAAGKRANATSYNWYYTGSAQGIAAVSGSLYKANLSTGANFASGQVCVGVNYSIAPWYTSYCATISKCASIREEQLEQTTATIGYQNPFSDETTISFAKEDQTAKIHVYNAKGQLIEETLSTGSYRFGAGLTSGLYMVRIHLEGITETIKLIKE